MDLLAKLPPIIPGSQDDQAREIYYLLTKARNKGRLWTYYEPPSGVLINAKVKQALEQKGYAVIEHKVWDLSWYMGNPLKGLMKRKYYIGAPGRH